MAAARVPFAAGDHYASGFHPDPSAPLSAAMHIPVSELIVRFLERLGVGRIFGIPGSHILPVYDALYDSPIQTVLARHEQAAAFMACGHARVTGGIGACITTAGPGATNLVTAIASAYVDRLPVLAITGEAPTAMFGKGGLQESSGEGGSVDQVSLFAGITRYHRLIERTDYLANVLVQATQCLLSDTPGPVVLSIPFNVQKEPVDATLLDGIAFTRHGRPCLATPADVERSLDLLACARQPVIVAGHGCIRSGARAALTRLSRRLGIPVATSLKGKGAVDERSPLALGSLGVTSSGQALRYLREHADLAGEKNIPLKRLAQEPWLMREAGSGTRIAIEKLFASHGIELSPRLELGSNEAIKQAILSGLGISALSSHTLALDQAGQFAVLDAEGFPIMSHWYVVYPASRPPSVVARAFMDFLLSQKGHAAPAALPSAEPRRSRRTRA